MKALPKKPNFKKIEEKWQDFWEKNKIYSFDQESKKPIYSIDTPPPYASAEHLHVGHALHYTQFEIIARFWRMNGYNVYFPPCFDNNGMPTERYVEKKHNITKKDISRAAFIKLCRRASMEAEDNYSNRFFRALGHSYDWDLKYTTIDQESQRVAQVSFLRLVKEKLAYRAEEPTLWCPHCQTALAQAEVESKPRQTKLNWIYFELEDGKKIEIATTRPEFLPATVAVFVHPEDKRYKSHVGKTVRVPLFNLKVPILTDETVDPKFGSGIMMVCTFGDSEDLDKWKRHKLSLRIMINEDGTLNELAGKYSGLDFKTARTAILDDLTGQGYFIRDEPLSQEVGVCWRCGTAVEYLITKQWFIKVLNHKRELIKQAKKVKWHPAFMRKRFEDWTNNLSWDWCISRQRFYGVPIPVWYCKECGEPAFPSEKELPVDPTAMKYKGKCVCGGQVFVPEKDVFDTWMTSSMSPQLACRWLENPKRYKKLFPMSLRPQSHDIIRTWAFYTLLKSKYMFDSIPWREVMIGTYVLDSKGKGMHKSAGNVVWLPDLLEKYNADAIRYWVGTASCGEDLPFNEKEIVRGQKLLIKLWNTARFASMHQPALEKSFAGKKPELIDRWILSRLAQVTVEYIKAFSKYEIAKARKLAEMFFLHEFCDFYVEMVKYRLYGADKNSASAARFTLYASLLGVLKLFAPFVPHIAEEIFYSLFLRKDAGKKGQVKSIHLTEFDKQGEVDEQAIELGELACSVVSEIRKWKQKRNLSLGAEVNKLTISYPKSLSEVKDVIAGTMRIKDLRIEKGKLSISDT